MNAPISIAGRNPVFEWWRGQVTASVDHVRVVDKVRSEAGWNGRYAFMTLMSAGIAVLGLLLSSPAVVIGAMLISPLMGPIIGLGFGLATFDSAEIRTAATALALGVVLAVLFSALVVLLSPLQNVTEEIAARTRPNLFDLMVALFSALAGTYAMIRGREGTIVGVAIATALMPPLAVVGYGLATMNWTVFAGSLLLFFTNLMTIAVAAAILARLYGFGADLSPKHTLLQTVLAIAIFIAFAIPLGIALGQIGWEANASRQAREIVASQFGDDARVSQIEVDYDTRPIQITATVLTPEFQSDAERDSRQALTRLLGRPVNVALEQYRVGTGAQAEAAQIASAQANARQIAADRATLRLVDELALVAGVDSKAVLIDRDNQRVVVTAAPLPDAGLAVYRALEQRVANVDRQWDVTLVPPAAPLPEVTFDDEDKPDANALSIALWGANRLKVPIGVAGADTKSEIIVKQLIASGVAARAVSGSGGTDGAARLVWLAPETTAQ